MAIIKITEAVRAAARRLQQDRGLKLDRSDRDRLAAIAEGKRKQLDAFWWKKLHGVVDQNKLDKITGLADPAGNPNAHERAVAAAKLKAFKGRVPPGLRREPPPLPSRIEDWKRKPSKRQPARPLRRALLGTSDVPPDNPVLPNGEANPAYDPFYLTNVVRRQGPNPLPPIVLGTPQADALIAERPSLRKHVKLWEKARARPHDGVNTKQKRTGDRHLNKGDRHAPGYMRDYMRRRRAAAKTNEAESRSRKG